MVNIAQDVLCEEDRAVLEGPQSPICGGRDLDGKYVCAYVRTSVKVRVSELISTCA